LFTKIPHRKQTSSPHRHILLVEDVTILRPSPTKIKNTRKKETMRTAISAMAGDAQLYATFIPRKEAQAAPQIAFEDGNP
jgi:hypothetical protein